MQIQIGFGLIVYFGIVLTIKVPITPLLFLLHNRIQLFVLANDYGQHYKKVKQRLKEIPRTNKERILFLDMMLLRIRIVSVIYSNNISRVFLLCQLWIVNYYVKS